MFFESLPEDAEDTVPAKRRRERNYALLQAAGAIWSASIFTIADAVDEAIALLEEIERRQK